MNFSTDVSKQSEVKPFLLMQESYISCNIDEKDGQLTMLDRDFEGCVVVAFSKPMNSDAIGSVTFEGKQIDYVLKPMAIAQGRWMLAIKVVGLANEYNKEYHLHIEGFFDSEGNCMNPTDVILRTEGRKQPIEAYIQHDMIALQAATEGIVLLKNDNDTLPLSPGTINLIGTGQNLFRIGIVGAGKINPRYVVNFKEAIRDSQDYFLNESLSAFYDFGDNIFPDKEMISDAVNKSGTALILIARTSGENIDNSSVSGEYYLTDDEENIIRLTAESFEKTVVVLNTPYPMDVDWSNKYKIDALVYSGVGGMLGGQALFDVLTGKESPSGKLTDTWAKQYSDIPSSRNFYDSAKDGCRLHADQDIWVDTVYEEDIYIGYRYFDTFHVVPAFPFGYGLTYTTFKLDILSFDYSFEHGIKVLIDVTNTGTVAAKEVVQIYISKPNGNLEQPFRELIEFDKTKKLIPNETEQLTFQIPIDQLVSYDEKKAAFCLEAGTYSVFVGNCLPNSEKIGSFDIEKYKIIKQVENHMVPVERPVILSSLKPIESFPVGNKSGIKRDVSGIEPKRTPQEASAMYESNVQKRIQSRFNDAIKEKSDTIIHFSDVVNNTELAEDFAAQLTVEELARITVCASSGWGMHEIGVAGRLSRLEKWELPEMTVSDGNSGVNVRIPNIGLPTSVVCGATFNKQLIQEAGRVLGEEARELGVDLLLVPAMNLHRNPLNGRHAEYFSEDPYHTGIMAGYFCKGIMETGVGTSYKHCIANNCEASRKRNQSIMTERAIRDIYYKAFEIAMNIQMPDSIMTSYNAVNGTFCAADPELLREMFRKENGFDGFIMTDWNSYDSCDIIEMIVGGNNWITPGTKDDKYTGRIIEAVQNGKLLEECLIESVAYIVKSLARMQKRKK